MASKSTEPAPGASLQILKTAATLAVTGIIGWVITQFLQLPSDLKTACVGLAMLAGYVVYAFSRNTYLTVSRDLGANYMSDKTGIVEVFPNLEACKLDMQQEFRGASKVRMLLQIGRREFGDGEASYFTEDAKQKTQPGSAIRVLRASKSSPFLSEERAAARHTDIRRWRWDMRRLENELNLLQEIHGISIESREHFEPFLWRMFLFDDVAYVSGYLHQSDNDRKAAVYKLRTGETSLFAVFDKYFDYLWEKSDMVDPSASVAAWALNN